MKGKISFTIVLLIMACMLVSPAFAGIPGTAPEISSLSAIIQPASNYPVIPHSIVPEITEVGKISLSIDAIGENTGSGSVIIVKPAGATVRSAYMAAATTGFSTHKLAAGDIKIDGTPVTWDIVDFPNSIQSYNYFTDVTSIVKSKIDSAPAGDVSFAVSEVNTYAIDGEILAVIFDDPAQTTDNTVILLFGAQKTTGDAFNIGLASPIDKTDPNLNLDFSLGISFGSQPGLQYSQVEVNGQRLTTSAGGQDDGADSNGALITVGGVGDTNANPADPFRTDDAGSHYDDELYDLLPFIANGDDLIQIGTLNPSNDDNIFFAALNLRSVTAVVGEGIILSPSSDVNKPGEMHTLTAKVQDDLGNPVEGEDVTFTVSSGPNAGITAMGMTDANGEVMFSYTSVVEGTDTIIASITDDAGKTVYSNEATKTWKGDIVVPEFPTFALPVSMVLGVVFLVYTFRGRKE